ncbi:flagellar export protein FliJ [Nitrincola iocasae]|jgi:flagellar FliJ protein|uniref:Flagellar FliJ protein n=1 Tax=Nitrincola iocasae TaxID=2614693 RepID=A0A5J6LAA7_9GAMM|nr:flagellar export protein FliJ [Nitrincola iocasae]QEW05463.1 flagellar export protein FliJ [Nitrincola iocasae]
MSKARSERLGVVLDLSRRQREAADRYLADAQQRVQQAEAQLIQLQNYMLEYQQQFTQAGQQGMTTNALQQHQAFIGRLEHALRQQHDTIRVSRQQLAQVKDYWQSVYARFKGIEKLTDKARTDEQYVRDKREQQDIDERSQRSRTLGI